MADDKGGILVSPDGHESVTIDQDEYGKLAGILGAIRGEHGEHFDDMADILLHYMLKAESKPKTMEALLSRIVSYSMQEVYPEPSAVIVPDDWEDSTVYLNERERKTILNTVTTIRRGGWFADWLDTQVANIADPALPDERYPSPMRIAQLLTDAIQEWEESIAQAKVIVERRPDLFELKVASCGNKKEPREKPKPARKRRAA